MNNFFTGSLISVSSFDTNDRINFDSFDLIWGGGRWGREGEVGGIDIWYESN